MGIVGEFIRAGQVYVFLSGRPLFRTPDCPEWCPVEKKPVKMADFERFLENLTHFAIEYLIQISNEDRR